MQASPNTVPSSLSQDIREFCRTISSAEPVYVSSVPFQRSKSSFCFDNVELKVRKSGGSIVYGWAIWHLPSLYFEAEHHAVWRNKIGKLIDVSPQMGKRRRLLFLPDDNAIYDSMHPRQNIIAPDGDTAIAYEISELGNRRHSLLMRCRIRGTAEVRFYEADQLELNEIDGKIQSILNR